MWNPADPDYDCTPVSPARPVFGYAPSDPSATPFVTIVTPYYNAGDHFEATAESVLMQSFQQWEWLIVDDGTKDPESLEVLSRYEGSDPRIRVIHQENAGPSAARNRAYAEAKADYIAQIDADDLLEPTAIEKWVWFLQSYPEYGFVKGYAVGFGAETYLWQMGFHTPQHFFVSNPTQPNGLFKKSVHAEAGGYDEANREGFEDWDFWFRCAEKGQWGAVIPEYLDWYRRRESHNDRWSNWDGDKQQKAFVDKLKQRYPRIWKEGMPKIVSQPDSSFEVVDDAVPVGNVLQKKTKRLLMIIPWMTMGGSDRFTLDLLRELCQRGWEVSVVTTLHGENDWAHEFGRYTPDIFILENFLRRTDRPRFIHYLIQSRQIDTVLVTHSLVGYVLLPYLRSRCPDVTFVDYNHIEESEWLNGGYPRFGAGLQECLDLNITSSEHLKSWMEWRGAARERIEVCYTSIDSEEWKPDADARQKARQELEIKGDAVALIYPARLCDQKQPRVFMQTLGELRKTCQFVAIVAGDGPELGWMNRYAARHGLRSNIRFLGKVEADRVRGLMAASDVLFLPSKWEGIALSLYEAMATGLVVVTADVGGHRELVTPDCGYLVKKDTPEREVAQYGSILSKLIQNPEERRAMAERARDRVRESFGMQAMGDRMVALFERARQLHGTEPRPAIAPRMGLESATLGLEYLRLQDVAANLWQDRDLRLGLRKTWRSRMMGVAYRSAIKLPPGPRNVLAKIYRRWFQDNR